MKKSLTLKKFQIPAKRQKSVYGGKDFIVIEDDVMLRTPKPFIVIEDDIMY